MSSPRYDWWSYAKGMTRRYPQLKQQAQALGVGADGEAVLQGFPRIRMRELAAVQQALDQIGQLHRGPERLQMIRMVYWNRSHTLVGAALRLGISEMTAKRWNGEFLRAVGRAFGLMDGLE